ncbi:MAG: hypothetical protein ACHQ1D_13100, partial [Nitrososphaerales archaeon]
DYSNITIQFSILILQKQDGSDNDDEPTKTSRSGALPKTFDVPVRRSLLNKNLTFWPLLVPAFIDGFRGQHGYTIAKCIFTSLGPLN